MNCPFCLYNKTTVYNSRPSKKINQVWRRRQCLKCFKQFTTSELVDPSSIVKVKTSDGKTKPYSKATLLASILKACDHRELNGDESLYLLETIEQNILVSSSKSNQTVSSEEIFKICLLVLKRFDKIAAIKYKSYNS